MTAPEGFVPGTWNLDPTHSEVSFTVRHAGISKVRGTFDEVAAQVQAGESIESSSVKASIKTASINTGNADRDGHVKGADFFDVETYPEMTFESSSVELAGEDITINGTLTLHGVSKPVSLEGEFGGIGVDPFGTTRMGFSVETTISRKEFGITWNAALETGGVMLSDKVKISIDTEFVAPEA